MPLVSVGVFYPGQVGGDFYTPRDYKYLSKAITDQGEQPSVEGSNPNCNYYVRYNNTFQYWEWSHDNKTFYPIPENVPLQEIWFPQNGPLTPPTPGKVILYYDSNFQHLMISENGNAYQPVILVPGPIFGLAINGNSIDWDPFLNPFYYDDLLAGIPPWAVLLLSGSGNTDTVIDGVANHPGIVKLVLGGSAVGNSILVFGGSTTIHAQVLGDLDRFAVIVQSTIVLTGAANTFRIGFIGSTSSVEFRSTTGTTNWQCICNNAGTLTTVDSGVAVTAGNWYKMEIVFGNLSNVLFYINDFLVANINTNIPSSSVAGFLECSANANNAGTGTLGVDAVRFSYGPFASQARRT